LTPAQRDGLRGDRTTIPIAREASPMTKRPVDPGDFSIEELRFVRRLRKARRDAGLTQKQLAQRVDMAATYVSDIENLRVNPSLLTCMRLARGIGIDLAKLVQSAKSDDDVD
jgi:putative transcriptional regulator